MRRLDRRRKPRKAHVRHILVTGKPEAKMILESIQTAKKPLKVFRKMAKKYSNCPSGSKGGDLGEFIEGQMIQDFEEAVWASELETVPETFIKTQFGFHILWVHSKGQLE
ncbi:MAG: peptidylprolyl isomerase [Candidatus Poseidonia sp.]|nr:peptidylprolyl isomerase [Poseidonia sp.]MBL6748778.1 peptidylprolyl isomerase [Poseidonia sp.]MBL6806417.1 peptidylprolyl isomerase [Poseidonia sp.]MBL6886931.1 peptidylprolyl isomerase [Poseidonia sp.]MBL6892353.1 peptidylprolyl isomerase [Poseidonia sp.]